MQIPIKIDGSDGIPEWVMLELQGDLESRTNDIMSNKFIGDLHYTKQGAPVLIIGHHILHGKMQDLDKPYVVMRKVRTDAGAMDMDQEVGRGDDEDSRDIRMEFNIKAVIRKKLLFKNRPKPIIASSTNTP